MVTLTAAVKSPVSHTLGNTPPSLLDGQLAVNTTDRRLFAGNGSSVTLVSDQNGDRTNFVENPNFADGAVGYVLTGPGVAIVPENGYNGSGYSLKLTAGATGIPARTANIFPVRPGDTLYLEAWAMVGGTPVAGETLVARIRFLAANKSTSMLAFNVVFPITDTSYTKRSGSVTVPATAAFAWVDFIPSATLTTTTWWVGYSFCSRKIGSELLTGVAAVAFSGSAADLSAGTLLDARLPTRLGTVAKSISDWNSAVENGYYMGSAASNAPGSGWYIGSVIAHNGLYQTQTAWQFSGNTEATDTKTYRRECNNGTWSSWYRVWQTEGELDARYLKYLSTTLGLTETRKVINNEQSGAIYQTSVGTWNGELPHFSVIRYLDAACNATAGVPRAFGAYTQILATFTHGYEYAAEHTLEEKVAQTSRKELVGGMCAYKRFATAAGTQSAGWAGYDEIGDWTGLKSSLSGGELRGREIFLYASAEDDGNKRIGLDVTMAKASGYAGTDTAFAFGVRVLTPAYFNFPAAGVSTIGTAFYAAGEDPAGVGGGILRGFVGYVKENGVIINGVASNSVFDAFVSSEAKVFLGQNSQASRSASIRFKAHNSVNAAVEMAYIDAGVSTTTAGAEDGRIFLNVKIDGVDKQVIGAYPATSSTNPVFLYVNGALKNVDVGVPDSGGTGYRLLRVPN